MVHLVKIAGTLSIHCQFPHVAPMLWHSSDDVVTILSPACGTSRQLQNLCATLIPHECDTGYVAAAHAVTAQLPNRHLRARFLHGHHGGRYPVPYVCGGMGWGWRCGGAFVQGVNRGHTSDSAKGNVDTLPTGDVLICALPAWDRKCHINAFKSISPIEGALGYPQVIGV